MAIAAGVAVALAVIAVAVAAYAGTRSTLLGQIDSALRGITDQALHHGGGSGAQVSSGGPPFGGGGGGHNGFFFTGGGGGQDCDRGLGINGPQASAFGGAAGFVQLITPMGTVCRGNGETLEIPADPRATALARSGSGQFYANKTVDGTDIRVLVTAVPGIGALEVALPLHDVNHTLNNLLLLMAIIAAAGIALAVLFGLLVSRTAVAPIARFTRQTEAIAARPERLETDRLDVSGSDELARLGRTFNETLDALEQSVAAQRNLVADASHELRTPIASIRANLQLLRDEKQLPDAERAALREDVIAELDELTALVSDVVELARGARPTGEASDVRLDEIVLDVAERTQRRAPELTVQAHVEPTLVRGDADRIARAVTNVIDNARKWSPPGGVIEVELRGGTVSVRDHGPGFHDEDLPFVFDRFHRAKDARAKPGSGLGLAIVRQAADAHGGLAEAANAAGGGAIVTVSFGPGVRPDEVPAADTSRGSTLTA
jgi:two-component system sensor histidine kinase MprB